MKISPLKPEDAVELQNRMKAVTAAKGAVAVAKHAVVDMINVLCTMADLDPKCCVLSDDGLYFISDDKGSDKPFAPIVNLFDTKE